MNDELFFIMKQRLITAKEAAAALGYRPEYIAKLCRERKIPAKQIEKLWYIDPAVLDTFLKAHAQDKAHRQFRFSQEMRAVPSSAARSVARTVSTQKIFTDGSPSPWKILDPILITVALALIVAISGVVINPR